MSQFWNLQWGAVPFVSYIEVHVSLFHKVSKREKKQVVYSLALDDWSSCGHPMPNMLLSLTDVTLSSMKASLCSVTHLKMWSTLLCQFSSTSTHQKGGKSSILFSRRSNGGKRGERKLNCLYLIKTGSTRTEQEHTQLSLA